jgi:hypothetical protein
LAKLPGALLGVVTINKTRELLADKGHTQVYDDIKAGLLDARKDGTKTVVTVASIAARIASMPPAELIEPAHLANADKRHDDRRKRRPKRSHKASA